MLFLESPKSICRTIGARSRALRLARNLSQQELARMASASLSSIRRFESGGQGALDLAARIAVALQATDGIEPLFALPQQTIAQAEAAAQTVQRQRARKRPQDGAAELAS
ncbi:MAG: helix-turn-helix transcriptional regulator [Burkholderiaceae bacterium]|jgi:transcriptional regulator with XRE-family HTH domain|nr:helix-turn-helix transcriptional regulator [Burkholderiaceae bacterium]